MASLAELLAAVAALHHHLCPRQVLGVRMGLYAGALLDLDVPQPTTSKRLLTIAETDGCAADGIAVATNCWVGRRTLRIEDYGKVAATFVDTHTERAVRIVPSPQARQLARASIRAARNTWEAYLLGYQRLPAAELLSAEAVQLKSSVTKIIGAPGMKVACGLCGEEIMNGREIIQSGIALCRACAGHGYYADCGISSSPNPTCVPSNTVMSVQ